MAKCEVISCNEETEFYLCEEHREQAQNPNYKVHICKKCYSIARIKQRSLIFGNHPRKEQFVWLDKCDNCIKF